MSDETESLLGSQNEEQRSTQTDVDSASDRPGLDVEAESAKPATEPISVESAIPPWKAYGALAVVSFSFFADNFGAMIVTPVVTEVEQGGQKTDLVDGDTCARGYAACVSLPTMLPRVNVALTFKSTWGTVLTLFFISGGILLAAYGMLYIVGTVIAGPLQAALGNFRLMLFAAAVLVTAAFLMLASHNYSTFFSARLLQGLASALNDVGASAFLVRYFRGRNVAFAFGLAGAFCNLGLVVGPLAGGVLHEQGGFTLMSIALAVVFGMDGIGRMLFSIATSEESVELKMISSEMIQKYMSVGGTLMESIMCCFVFAATLLAWTIVYGTCIIVPYAFRDIHGTSTGTNALMVPLLFAPSIAASPLSGMWAVGEKSCLQLIAGSFFLLGVSAAMLGMRLHLQGHIVAIIITGFGMGVFVPAAKELLRLAAREVFVSSLSGDVSGDDETSVESALDSIWAFYFVMQGFAMLTGHIGVAAITYRIGFSSTWLMVLLPLAVGMVLLSMVAGFREAKNAANEHYIKGVEEASE